MLRLLLVLVVLGCGSSHNPDAGTDAGEPDAPVDAPTLDAPTLDAPTLDAPTLDASPLEDPTLIVMSRGEPELTFTWVKLDGSVERVIPYEMPPDHTFFWLSPSPDGELALVLTRLTISEIPFVVQYFPVLVDWESGTNLDLLELVRPLDPDGVCERAAWDARWPRWRSDGRAVYLPCSIWEFPDGGPALEEVTFEITADGEVSRLGDACTGVVLPTDDERVVLNTGSTCDDRRYAVHPDGSELALDPADGDVVHSWYDGAAIASTVTDVAGNDRHERLRSVSPEGSVEIWVDSPPHGSTLMPLSTLGHHPMGFGAEGTHLIDSVSIRRVDGTFTATALSECSSFRRVPATVRWAPDARAFTASCRDRTWIVRADGGVTVLRQPAAAAPNDLSWSPGSEFILISSVADRTGVWSVNDSTTGRIIPVPVFEELDPRSVRWSRQPWTPRCAGSISCPY